jgi:nicotinamide mononucleotide (NMN) deamidase PncC
MTNPTRDQLARQIHAQPTRLVLAVTGGGSRAISSLSSVEGASRTMLEAIVPYAPGALVEWLGGKPDEFCSDWTARAMAMQAFLVARRLEPTAPVCGLSCTASLASDRPKRGSHRAHLAAQTASTTTTWSIELEKGARSRHDEENVIADLLLNLAATATGVADRLEVSLAASEQLMTANITAQADQQDLLAGRAQAICLGASPDDARPQAVFPGAFHPLHAAHRQMASIAAEILRCPVAYELSVVNVDKPPLDFLEIDHRARQFAAGEPLWLSRAPLYVDKAALFPGATFVVGADTIERIGQTRYYASEDAMEAAIDQIGRYGCKFLVFGRQVDGTFRSLASLVLPTSLLRLCQEVPESQFRIDLSSTELRQQSLGQPLPESG